VDLRIFLPEDWAKDKVRRRSCHVPKGVKFRTRHQLCLEMLNENGVRLPHRWVAGDAEMGRSTRFRNDLRQRNERYLLAVPSDTNIRDLDSLPPPWSGNGPYPKRPFERVDYWMATIPEAKWKTIHIRDGEKGPLLVKAIKTRVVAKTADRRIGPEELLFITHCADEDGKIKHDYYLSNAPADTPLEELARVANAEHRIEECIERAKGEAGLSEYETRTWEGWYHHQILSIIATWFLVLETLRAKKNSCDNRSTDCVHPRLVAATAEQGTSANCAFCHAST